jgi:hypothetical protein
MRVRLQFAGRAACGRTAAHRGEAHTAADPCGHRARTHGSTAGGRDNTACWCTACRGSCRGRRPRRSWRWHARPAASAAPGCDAGRARAARFRIGP